MPAELPFQSQVIARPNNRRHRQLTAMHPQTTSTPNLSQTLVISRQTLIPAPLRERRPSHPEIPKILQILIQTTASHALDCRAIANLKFSATFTYLMEELGKIQTPSR